MATLTQPLPESLSATTSPGAAAWRAYHAPTPATAAANGGEADREFIEHHLPLVKTVVGRMRIHLPPHLDGDELHSIGLTGLMTAVRRYNPAQGNTFHGYAMLCIRGAVLDELRRLDWMPRALRHKAKQLKETLTQLEGEHGRAVTEEEAARALNMEVAEYQTLLDEVRPISFVPLDGESEGSGETGYLHETIADEQQPLPGEALERRELLAVVAKHIQQLPDMQRKVLAFYYHEGMRLSEIAAVFNVTESRISQIHTQAVLALRGFVKRALES